MQKNELHIFLHSIFLPSQLVLFGSLQIILRSTNKFRTIRFERLVLLCRDDSRVAFLRSTGT
jgi:hypothetical protein